MPTQYPQLLDLPSELRLCIFEMILPSRRSFIRSTGEREPTGDHVHTVQPLLLTSKQISEEAASIFYLNSRFKQKATLSQKGFLDKETPPSFLNITARLQNLTSINFNNLRSCSTALTTCFSLHPAIQGECRYCTDPPRVQLRMFIFARVVYGSIVTRHHSPYCALKDEQDDQAAHAERELEEVYDGLSSALTEAEKGVEVLELAFAEFENSSVDDEIRATLLAGGLTRISSC